MNIQIFGSKKSFDSKKAERFFKERQIRYQYIDLQRYGLSRGELKSVAAAVGLDSLAEPKDPDYPLFQHLASDEARLEKLYEIPEMLRTPLVRNGKRATVGYAPEIWEEWIKSEK